MTTKVLYYADSYLWQFSATVLAHGLVGDRPAIALDASAFYPEGGGQPADQGTLNDVSISDVQVRDGVIWHIPQDATALEALPVGAVVVGRIDQARRFDHMQQHCGQHILTAAFIATCDLPTVSFHLSEASVTIDLATSALTAAQITAAEDLANRIIWENRPISARIVTPEELASLPLRKPPSVHENVRVVTIADFDYSACGGTHPAASGAVGQIRVLGWSRQRGAVRVEFACGGRALAIARQVMGAAADAAASLKIGVSALPEAVERMLLSQKAQAKELEQAQVILDRMEAERHYAEAAQRGKLRLVIAERSDDSPERLRRIAQAIAAQVGAVAVLGACSAGRAHLVVACAGDSGCDARALLQRGIALIDGRGGGTAQLAQGGGTALAGLGAALAAIAAALE